MIGNSDGLGLQRVVYSIIGYVNSCSIERVFLLRFTSRQILAGRDVRPGCDDQTILLP